MKRRRFILIPFFSHHDLMLLNTQELADLIMNTPEDSTWKPEFGQCVKALWAERPIKLIYHERDRLYSLNDGAA